MSNEYAVNIGIVDRPGACASRCWKERPTRETCLRNLDKNQNKNDNASAGIAPFIERLQSHSELESDDARFLAELPASVRTVSPGHYVVRERMDHTLCFVLLSGVMMSHKVGGDGGRQILSIAFPGELLNIESLFFDRSNQNIQALREAQVASFQCQPLVNAMFERPPIGKALVRETLIKASIARQWMTGARMEAAARVARLLCEMAVRLEQSGLGAREKYELPVTQEQIAEIISVTPLHASRVMRTLDEEGLIRRSRPHLEILDWGRLAARGDFEETYLHGNEA